MDTKALRQKILDLAIHGKLVPQDPNDEPASVLLERIRAEKERLIKEGKIKKGKKSAKTSDKPHYPYELPKGWEWCRLEDYVFSVTDGDHQAPPKVSKGIPFLVISNIADGSLDFSNTRYVPEEYYEKIQMERKPKRGDILFSVTGSYGIVVNIKTDRLFCFQRHIGLIKPTISNEYLSFVLMSNYIKSLCDKLATGTAQKTVGLDTLRSLYVPIAPIEEQERIVAKIKHLLLQISFLEAGKGKLVAAIKQAKSKILDLAIHGKLVPQDPNDEPASELLKRINPKAEIITDNGHYQKLPVGWCEVWLGEIFNHNTGKALNASNTEGIMRKYLTTSNVYWNTFDFTTVKQMYFKNNELDKCSITKGDLLVCEGGDIGRAAIWNYDYNICIQNHLHRLRPKISGLCVSFYYYVFNYLKVNNMIGGKGIGLLGLSSNALHKLHVPFPPLAEQTRIAAKIEELFHQLDMIEESL